MDALSEALHDVRVTGALFLNAELSAPWGYTTPPVATFAALLAPRAEQLVLFHLITAGEATARVADEVVTLEAGEIVVIAHGDAHDLWNGQSAALADASALLPKILSGTLATERGGGGGAVTSFVCGYFGCEREFGRRLLAGFPPLFKVRVRDSAGGTWLESAIIHAVSESAEGRPGRPAVLARLSEALFIETLCRYMDELPPMATGWLAAARDEVTGNALALLHRQPAHPWTLDGLAREIGVSRSVLAERFTRYLGESPLSYLASWRLQLAARLLATTHDKVLKIALDVGYESEAAFNRAFRRQFGLPPGRYRRRVRGDG